MVIEKKSSEAHFEFETPNADIIRKALLPELESREQGSIDDARDKQRSDIKLEAKSGKLYLHIFADDLVMLRAALNTWLRLVMVAEETSEGHRRA